MPIGDVADMAAHLPRESATMLAVTPQQEIEMWGTDSYLLAYALDLLAAGNWQRGGGKGARPKPIPRPKAESEPVTTADLADFRSWYAEQPGGRQLD